MKKTTIMKDLLYDLAGGLIQAAALQFFILPRGIALGGVPGVAQIIHYVGGFTVGVLSFLINIPLFAAAGYFLGREITCKTIKSVIILSISLDFIGSMLPAHYEGDRIIAAVFGGTITGAAQGLIFMRNSTGGGGDIVAKIILQKYPGIKIGHAIMMVNLIVMAVYAIVLRELETVLYGIICMVCMTQALNAVLYGINRGAAMIIVSEKGREIAAVFVRHLNRGVTIYDGTGVYSRNAYTTVFCVMNSRQIPMARVMIDSIDQDAFIVVSETRDIYGKGFTNIY